MRWTPQSSPGGHVAYPLTSTPRVVNGNSAREMSSPVVPRTPHSRRRASTVSTGSLVLNDSLETVINRSLLRAIVFLAMQVKNVSHNDKRLGWESDSSKKLEQEAGLTVMTVDGSYHASTAAPLLYVRLWPIELFSGGSGRLMMGILRVGDGRRDNRPRPRPGHENKTQRRNQSLWLFRVTTEDLTENPADEFTVTVQQS
ncbi:unnamed protein product [Cyprideis torosa]|uniref:Uncharacterized protein n=1 Tax=Cyprideis torosa TaxID=163714 RepID=A0A7R8ZI13_9CRUS|nr:unnamed protein product [Cyprideis torosa]CAG0883759.1 unnamed protein product [Cyprideis torosa]